MTGSECAEAASKAGALERWPNFCPWIGADYGMRAARYFSTNPPDVNGRFLHVLGESHYLGDYPEDIELTRSVVSDWAFGEGRGGLFFRRIAQATQECELDAVDARKAWSGIAYSNYVQSALTGPRRAPSAEQWREAERSFVAQLMITRPTTLLVLGRRLWDNLPSSFGWKCPPLQLRKDQPPVTDAWIYPYWRGKQIDLAVAVWTYHPSSGKFDWRDAAHKILMAEAHYDNLLGWCWEKFGRPF